MHQLQQVAIALRGRRFMQPSSPNPKLCYGPAEQSTAPAVPPKTAAEVAQRYGWTTEPTTIPRAGRGRLIKELPVDAIIRPLGRTRANGEEMQSTGGMQAQANSTGNWHVILPLCPSTHAWPSIHADQDKVAALMVSIKELGLQEPVGQHLGEAG